MICFAKPGLTEHLYIVRKEVFSITCCSAVRTLDRRPSIFIRDKLIFFSERVLHKDYDRNGSVEEKKSLVVSLKGLGAKTNLLAVNRQS
jgi:hypothetical protein